MSDVEKPAAACGAALRGELEKFCDQLQAALGDGLQMIALYGGLAKGDYDPAGSDVNVIVVLSKITLAELDRIAPLAQQAARAFRLAPLILSERDLRRSTDVFPIKFLDMQQHHELLRGRDLLAELEIKRDHLRVRAEQQIKNLLLRLRHSYLRRSHRPELIAGALTGAISSLVSSLAALLIIKTGHAPRSKRAIVDAAATAFDIDARDLQRVIDLKARRLEPDDDELRSLYGAFMAAVERAADAVDRL